MHALASKSPHVPFRDSKLTQLLQDSLSGQAKSMMFVHVAPEVRPERKGWQGQGWQGTGGSIGGAAHCLLLPSTPRTPRLTTPYHTAPHHTTPSHLLPVHSIPWLPPQASSSSETLSTLNFARGVTEITLGAARKNVESGALLDAKDRVSRGRAVWGFEWPGDPKITVLRLERRCSECRAAPAAGRRDTPGACGELACRKGPLAVLGSGLRAGRAQQRAVPGCFSCCEVSPGAHAVTREAGPVPTPACRRLPADAALLPFPAHPD
jgi:hypothetical protein